jgi:hypothetical protein
MSYPFVLVLDAVRCVSRRVNSLRFSIVTESLLFLRGRSDE